MTSLSGGEKEITGERTGRQMFESGRAKQNENTLRGSKRELTDKNEARNDS